MVNERLHRGMSASGDFQVSQHGFESGNIVTPPPKRAVAWLAYPPAKAAGLVIVIEGQGVGDLPPTGWHLAAIVGWPWWAFAFRRRERPSFCESFIAAAPMPFGRLSFRGFVAHQHPCTLSGTFWSGKPQTGVNNPYREYPQNTGTPEHPQKGYDPPQFGDAAARPHRKPVERRSARPGHRRPRRAAGPPARLRARRAGRAYLTPGRSAVFHSCAINGSGEWKRTHL